MLARPRFALAIGCLLLLPAEGAEQAPEAAAMAAVYEAGREGLDLYKEGRHADALPHLAMAAERGFKLPQAALADIYLNGLGGVPRDSQAGLGWLGVAAAPETAPRIAEVFEATRAKIPPSHEAAAERLIAIYRERYGPGRHGVACGVVGSVVKDLRCHFADDPAFRDGRPSGADDVETVVVSAERIQAPAPELGRPPSGAFISAIYDAATRGVQLYREGRYADALPFLVAAGKRGFKQAQALAADIYLEGRGGIPIDIEAGIGWLGVAAAPASSASIRMAFETAKADLPPKFTPAAVREIVRQYRAQYSHKRHRVTCRMAPIDGTTSLRMKQLRCNFMDEATQCRNTTVEDGRVTSEWTCKPLDGARTVNVLGDWSPQ
jgi:TPR repeat protein